MRGQLCAHNSVGAALMIDQTAGTELGNGEESWSLQNCCPFRRGDKCIEGQTWEVVTREEPFSRQVAICIKVRSIRSLSAFKHIELFRRPEVAASRFLTLAGLERRLLLNLMRLVLFAAAT